MVQDPAKEFGTVHVPLQAAFDAAATRAHAAYWLWDGVHPTHSGHDLIAKEWLSVAAKRGILNG